MDYSRPTNDQNEESHWMKKLIDQMLELLPQLTKEEADSIEEILKWDDDKKAAFILAKKLFEDEDE